MNTLIAFFHDHPTVYMILKVVAWPIVAGIVLSVVRRYTADQWVHMIGLKLRQKWPRLSGLLMMLESMSWVWEEFYAGFITFLTGKFPIPDTLPTTQPATPTVVVTVEPSLPAATTAAPATTDAPGEAPKVKIPMPDDVKSGDGKP